MKKSLKRAAAASAVCAVSLAGTLATNPTALAGEATGARGSQKALTEFGMKAQAFGTKVSVGGIDVKSLKDSQDILACTRTAGIERSKTSTLEPGQYLPIPDDLVRVSPSTSTTQTYRDGAVTGTRAVNTIADIRVGGEVVEDLRIPTLKIEGLRAIADSFHDPADADGDGNPFGTAESFDFKGISLDYEGTVVEGTPLADLLDIVNDATAPVNETVSELVTLLTEQLGQVIEIPGLGSIGLGSSFSKLDANSATSGANALKIEVDPTEESNDSVTLLKLGYAQSRIAGSKPSGVFRSTIMGLDFEALPLTDDVSVLHLGGIGTESIPCEGTGNKKVVKTIEGERAIPLNIPGIGGVAVLDGLEYSYKAKQMSKGRARSMAKSSLASFTIPALDLEITGISSKLNLLSRDGERVRGSKKPKFKVADILHEGVSLMPEGGLKIGQSVEFPIAALQRNGFITYGPRFTRNYYGAKVSALAVDIPGIVTLDLGWLESQIYAR